MKRQTAVLPYKGILLSLKREGNSDTCHKMDIALSEIRHRRTNIVWFQSRVPRIIKIQETESRRVGVRGWGWGDEELGSRGTGDAILEMEGGDRCTPRECAPAH